MNMKMILTLSLIILISGCAGQPTSLYNYDHEQDGYCYGEYGGQWGYCDKGRRE